MAFCGSHPFHLLLLVVFAVVVPTSVDAKDAGGGCVPDMGVDLAATCPPIDACRGGVANQQCCTTIATAISAQGSCSCVCRVLKIYGAQRVTAACVQSPWCPRCSLCNCS